MVIANVSVNASSAKTLFCQPLPVGGSGLQVRFTFDDPAWKDLAKTVVFRNRSKTLNTIISDDCAAIPHELLTSAMDVLHVGLYGTDSSQNLIIPTVWAKLGEICPSANPSADHSTAATLPYWAQVQESLDQLQRRAMDMEDLENALNEAKASGAFNGPPGSPGAKGDKGDKGDRGAQGMPGSNGADGRTPVKGVDYWTDADKNEIKTFVEEAILGGAW